MSQNLFAPNAVFFTEKQARNEIFEEVYQKLLKLNYVKGNFLDNVIQRENTYPTGIDTSPISGELANVAIPHTEGEFVNTRLIVPIALKYPVKFNNMIDPSQELEVKFLFMILNNDPEGQANILAQIMDFLASTSVLQLNKLFNLTDTNKIYEFLSENFKQKVEAI
ncbi:PTS sugar transporter subunit IIA [Lactobacillus mulieris]|uniref:PTS sugar transporter subunit IIA n=1 Tax=Lactobacillus mulieris TaxID=2508708 RepID=A0AAW5WYS1_9LACO|nr:PTS sugar transporter subunit IIA [Lactobacillus mulieris]MCZ3622216.1 PTS sugar transporter subunit IIA [Lactobacillus mulieris]MCZ3623994.1 PTS sugar transporter subunit IIA [Lactobacillus mulieris]MCZ3636223.1 PTS sugar transporter subunit IIA [Lactobacillus mulieris]MCZ3689767.1 PTS sugar transporter subunit IIA [Lactobacillus mulieris]MCZ3695770.1 PTS sugar transporter subunit IIA [Lactobacillus mulieris]